MQSCPRPLRHAHSKTCIMVGLAFPEPLSLCVCCVQRPLCSSKCVDVAAVLKNKLAVSQTKEPLGEKKSFL